jgi:hypothetical protein
MGTEVRWQTQGEYSSCQLVAATNAALYLGTMKRRPSKKRWERLVDLTLCRAGSCLAVSEAHKAFGIEEVEIPKTLRAVRYHVVRMRPVETGIWLPWTGFHSILVVGFAPGPAPGYPGSYATLNWCKEQGNKMIWINGRELGAGMLHITKGKGTLTRGYCYFRRKEGR